MKVLQINNCHFKRGGADVVYLNTGKLLADHGYQVYYFSIMNEKNVANSYSKYFVNSIDFINASFFKKVLSFLRFFYSFEARNKIKTLLDELKPDIAHIHLYKGGLTPSILGALKNRQVPVVITLHDYGFLDPHNLLLDGNLEISEKCIHGSAWNCVLDKSNRNSYVFSLVSTLEYIFHSTFFPFDRFFDRIIAVSKFSQLKHQESKKFKWKIDHLYNFSPMFKQDYVLKEQSEGYMLYFGRLSKEKGVKTLMRAISEMDEKIPLKIAGTGPLLEEFERYIKVNKLSQIQLLGYKSGLELQNLIQNAKFVVVPSEWYENNPMTIIESYCYGVPVIGSNIGGIPEIIEENKTGFLYEMADVEELKLTLKKAHGISQKSYLKMKFASREFAEKNFSPKLHAQKLVELYKRTIQRLN